MPGSPTECPICETKNNPDADICRECVHAFESRTFRVWRRLRVAISLVTLALAIPAFLSGNTIAGIIAAILGGAGYWHERSVSYK